MWGNVKVITYPFSDFVVDFSHTSNMLSLVNWSQHETKVYFFNTTKFIWGRILGIWPDINLYFQKSKVQQEIENMAPFPGRFLLAQWCSMRLTLGQLKSRRCLLEGPPQDVWARGQGKGVSLQAECWFKRYGKISCEHHINPLQRKEK